jgi:hypothetical protein
VDGVVSDASPLPRRYEPGHPDADPEGYVTYPQCQSGHGNDRPAQRGAGLPAKRVGGAGGEEYDPAVAADLELTFDSAGEAFV